MEYEPVIGLEIHAELSTRTKIYCSCRNEFGAEVNTECCPICTGMPGTLPTLNEKVVEYAVRAGVAAGCKINRVCKQDRKNYFYPDLPKAYQISQYDVPLCERGGVDIYYGGREKRIGITRIHIEEDAGKLLHGDAFSGTLVDFNRCGVPLIEIVSEPDLRSAGEAKCYLETWTSILAALGVSDVKMQEGSVRCDVNVSIRPKGSRTLGTRCEMKNVNSYGGVYRAIEYEIRRQTDLLEHGGAVEQQTRRWDDARGRSELMRSKEDAEDYRYFPEPDLRVIVVTDELYNRATKDIPELPNKKKVRLMKQYGLPEFDAGLLSENAEKAALFEQCAALGNASARALSNWLVGDVTRLLNESGKSLSDTPLTARGLSRLAELAEKKTISSTGAKTVLEQMFRAGGDPDEIVKEKGLRQVSDEDALLGIVRKVVAENEKSVAAYRKGKTNAVGYLIGQCMRATGGRANPQVVRALLVKELAQNG